MENEMNWVHAGKMLEEQGDFVGAFRIVEAANAAAPDDFKTNFAMAWAHFRLKNYQECIDFCHRTLETDGERKITRQAFNLCGNANKRIGQIASAVENWKNAVEATSHPRWEDFYNYACGLALMGKTKESLQYLDLAIVMDPSKNGQALVDPDFQSLQTNPDFQLLLSNALPDSSSTGIEKAMRSEYVTVRQRGFELLLQRMPQSLPEVPEIQMALDVLMAGGMYKIEQNFQELAKGMLERKPIRTRKIFTDAVLDYIETIQSPMEMQIRSFPMSEALHAIYKYQDSLDPKYAPKLLGILERLLPLTESGPLNEACGSLIAAAWRAFRMVKRDSPLVDYPRCAKTILQLAQHHVFSCSMNFDDRQRFLEVLDDDGIEMICLRMMALSTAFDADHWDNVRRFAPWSQFQDMMNWLLVSPPQFRDTVAQAFANFKFGESQSLLYAKALIEHFEWNRAARERYETNTIAHFFVAKAIFSYPDSDVSKEFIKILQTED